MFPVIDSRAVLDPDSPAVGEHDLAADRQPQSRATRTRPRLVLAAEALEHTLTLIAGDPGPGV